MTGEKVRYTKDGVRWATPKKPHQRSNDVDWSSRRGVVARVCRNPEFCKVLWDGNSVVADAIPVKFLETY
jgi:hypothetical protein